MAKVSRSTWMLILIVLLMSISVVPAAQAQDESNVYDYDWLLAVSQKEYAAAINEINLAWETRTQEGQWRNEGGKGTWDIVANSVIIGSKVGGNDPAFAMLAPNIWFSPEGGRFSTNEGFRAFQLENAVHPANIAEQPTNVSEVVSQLATYKTYGAKINFLDVLWSGNSEYVVNRWGSSAWMELLTAEQQQLLKDNDQRPNPILQQLPGDVIVWGELCANPDPEWGLEKISENIYRTTGLGGTFCTDRGFRAMQVKSLNCEESCMTEPVGVNLSMSAAIAASFRNR